MAKAQCRCGSNDAGQVHMQMSRDCLAVMVNVCSDVRRVTQLRKFFCNAHTSRTLRAATHILAYSSTRKPIKQSTQHVIHTHLSRMMNSMNQAVHQNLYTEVANNYRVTRWAILGILRGQS